MIREVMCLLLLAVGTEVASDPDIKNLQVHISKSGYQTFLKCATNTAWQSVQVNLATWTDSKTLGPGYTKLIPSSGAAECLAAYSMENDTITDEIECATWSRSKDYNAFAIEDDTCIIYGPKYSGTGTCDSSRPYVYVSNSPVDFNITDAPTINVTDVSEVSIDVASVTWALDDPCNVALEVSVCRIASDGTKACVSTDNPEQATMNITGLVMCQYNTVYAEVSSATGVSTSANATLDPHNDATQSITITHVSILDDSSVEVSWDYINYCNLTLNATEVCVYGEYCNTFTIFTTEGTVTGVSFSTSCNISLDVTATVEYNTDSGTVSSSNSYNVTSNMPPDVSSGFTACFSQGVYGVTCNWDISDECEVLTGLEICLQPSVCGSVNLTSTYLKEIFFVDTYVFRNLEYLMSYAISFRFYYDLQDGQGDRIIDTGHTIPSANIENLEIYGPDGYTCAFVNMIEGEAVCFRLSAELMTYSEGEAYCQQQNAILMELTQTSNYQQIADFLKAPVYIALNDKDTEGQFTNPNSGVPVLNGIDDFDNMETADANGDLDCVVIMADYTGLESPWNNVKCDEKYRVMCQVTLEEGRPEQAYVCSDGSGASSGYCYHVSDEPMTQAAGVEWCEQNFGYAYFQVDYPLNDLFMKTDDVRLRKYHTGYKEYSEQKIFEHKMFGAVFSTGFLSLSGASDEEVECLGFDSILEWELVDCEEERHMICMKKGDLVPQLQTCPRDTDHFFYRFEDVCLSAIRGCISPDNFKATFSDAVSACESSGSSLASLDNGRMELIIKELACGSTFWIGLTDEGSPDQFHWVDGTPLNYTNWGQNQPEDGKDCVIYDTITTSWKTADCTENHEYVCKMDYVPPE